MQERYDTPHDFHYHNTHTRLLHSTTTTRLSSLHILILVSLLLLLSVMFILLLPASPDGQYNAISCCTAYCGGYIPLYTYYYYSILSTQRLAISLVDIIVMITFTPLCAFPSSPRLPPGYYRPGP